MILRAAWVVPVSGAPLRDAFVEFAGDRIAHIGAAAELPSDAQPVHDLGDAVLTPGLINAHTHLELTAYDGVLTPRPLWDWLLALIKLRAAPGQIEREHAGVQEGAWQSLRAGVTCVGDISRRCLHWPVLKPIPIRKVCFAELLPPAAEPPRNMAELRAAVAEIEEDALLTVGVSPHASYTVPADQIQAVVQLAKELDRPWCTHWAETAEERAFLLGNSDALPAWLREPLARCDIRPPRMTAIDFLEHCAPNARPGALAHFNYTEPGDAEQLAATGHTVVYCPRSHHYFGHRSHPYRELLDAGVRVAIGTDSAASNESLALLEELHFVRRQTPAPPPAETLLQMVTISAARALGLHKQIGSLDVGKQADLAAFPCARNVTDPVAALIDFAPRPTHVWVAGQPVF